MLHYIYSPAAVASSKTKKMAMAMMGTMVLLMMFVQIVLLVSGLDGGTSLKAHVDDPDAVAEMVQM